MQWVDWNIPTFQKKDWLHKSRNDIHIITHKGRRLLLSIWHFLFWVGLCFHRILSFRRWKMTTLDVGISQINKITLPWNRQPSTRLYSSKPGIANTSPPTYRTVLLLEPLWKHFNPGALSNRTAPRKQYYPQENWLQKSDNPQPMQNLFGIKLTGQCFEKSSIGHDLTIGRARWWVSWWEGVNFSS